MSINSSRARSLAQAHARFLCARLFRESRRTDNGAGCFCFLQPNAVRRISITPLARALPTNTPTHAPGPLMPAAAGALAFGPFGVHTLAPPLGTYDTNQFDVQLQRTHGTRAHEVKLHLVCARSRVYIFYQLHRITTNARTRAKPPQHTRGPAPC